MKYILVLLTAYSVSAFAQTAEELYLAKIEGGTALVAKAQRAQMKSAIDDVISQLSAESGIAIASTDLNFVKDLNESKNSGIKIEVYAGYVSTEQHGSCKISVAVSNYGRKETAWLFQTYYTVPSPSDTKFFPEVTGGGSITCVDKNGVESRLAGVDVDWQPLVQSPTRALEYLGLQ